MLPDASVVKATLETELASCEHCVAFVDKNSNIVCLIIKSRLSKRHKEEQHQREEEQRQRKAAKEIKRVTATNTGALS